MKHELTMMIETDGNPSPEDVASFISQLLHLGLSNASQDVPIVETITSANFLITRCDIIEETNE